MKFHHTGSAEKNPEKARKADELFEFLESHHLHSFIESLTISPEKKFGVFSFPIGMIDPLACLEVLTRKNSFRFYWEKPHVEFAMAAGGSTCTISSAQNDRFQKADHHFTELKKRTAEFSAIKHSCSGLHILGGGSFFNRGNTDAWKGFDPVSFKLPEWLIIKHGQLCILTIALEVDDQDNKATLFRKLKSVIRKISVIFNLDSENVLKAENNTACAHSTHTTAGFRHWMRSVEKAKELIRINKFQKIVLARRLKVLLKSSVTPTILLHRLRERYPNCFSFLINFPGSETFIGCSPERLVSFHNKYLRIDALAGSIRRGGSATEDAVFEKQLLNSSKDIKEHQFVTKAIEQHLRKFTTKIEHHSKPTVKKLANVQHLYTPIRARLRKNASPLSVLEELHPTPAVGGYPWKDAGDYISRLENFDRGWYAGPVGWLNSGGGEFAVAIRSGLMGKKKARFFAGCGIVKDSDPESEWQETNLKLMPMLSALKNE